MLARIIHYTPTAAARFLRYGRRKPNKCVSTRRLRLVLRCSVIGWLRAMSGRRARRAAGRAAVGISIPLQNLAARPSSPHALGGDPYLKTPCRHPRMP